LANVLKNQLTSISPLDKEAGEVQNSPFSHRTDLTAGGYAKSAACWLYASCTSQKANCYFLASLLANAQELVSFFLLSALLLNE